MPEHDSHDYLRELENDPAFQDDLINFLHLAILKKKFGTELFRQYMELRHDQKWDASTDDTETLIDGKKDDVQLLFPEVYRFDEELLNLETVESTLSYARDHQVNLTEEEISEAKKNTLEAMVTRKRFEENQ